MNDYGPWMFAGGLLFTFSLATRLYFRAEPRRRGWPGLQQWASGCMKASLVIAAAAIVRLQIDHYEGQHRYSAARGCAAAVAVGFIIGGVIWLGAEAQQRRRR